MRQIIEEYNTYDGWEISKHIKEHLKQNPTHYIEHLQTTNTLHVGNYGEPVLHTSAIVIYIDKGEIE